MCGRVYNIHINKNKNILCLNLRQNSIYWLHYDWFLSLSGPRFAAIETQKQTFPPMPHDNCNNL